MRRLVVLCLLSAWAAFFVPVASAATAHPLSRVASPLATTRATGNGPAFFHSVYQLPSMSPAGQTIGIVDAFDSPTVKTDLDVYDSRYGLAFFPSCSAVVTEACFEKVDQTGGSSYPAPDEGWAFEIALDAQVAHAICQNCKILLVEANSNEVGSLGAAVNTAVRLGATVVSNSYGTYDEYNPSATLAAAYDHPGIAVTVASGDWGYRVSYPANLDTVVAVGGTSVKRRGNGSASESVWAGTGSGCSAYRSARSWQMSLSNWAATECGSHRGVADVAADADPRTGASVYDSYPYSGQTGWWQVGGTSLSAPIIAAVYALAGNAASVSYPAGLAYSSRGSLYDVVSGATSGGACGMVMCIAGVGYDGPTGLGTPRGLGGF